MGAVSDAEGSTRPAVSAVPWPEGRENGAAPGEAADQPAEPRVTVDDGHSSLPDPGGETPEPQDAPAAPPASEESPVEAPADAGEALAPPPPTKALVDQEREVEGAADAATAPAPAQPVGARPPPAGGAVAFDPGAVFPELTPEPSPLENGSTENAPDDRRSPSPGPVGRSAKPPLPRVLAVANQKGGVGKTTTAVNLGAGLADMGYRVLVVDLDPQGNATTGLGINARNLTGSVYDVLLSDVPVEDTIEPTAVRNLFVVPATIDLAGAEIELVPAFSRELKLRRAFDRLDGDFDFILVDCPPSLGLLTVNGLAAATEVLVPIQCEYYALEGLGQLMRNIQLVQSNLNPRLELSTIVLTMYDARTKLADQVAQEVRKHFGPKVCRTIVPRTVRLSEAPSFGQPIIVFDPSSRGAIAYRELAKEVSGGAERRSG